MKFTSKNLEKHIRFRQGYEFGVVLTNSYVRLALNDYKSDTIEKSKNFVY